MDQNKDGTGSLIAVQGDNFRITGLGRTAQAFIRDYVPQHPRHYQAQEVRPRVAIIRQEDGCWGEGKGWYPDTLFGNPNWPATPITKAWFAIWHLLTRGGVKRSGLSWGAHGQYSPEQPHRFLVPVDGVVVFDERVGGEWLQTVELLVLTGLGISPATLAAVRRRVQAGATAIALPQLAPPGVGHGTVADGQGRWIVTENFLDSLVREAVTPVLPPQDTIRYQFGNTTVSFTGLAGELAVEVSTAMEHSNASNVGYRFAQAALRG